MNIGNNNKIKDSNFAERNITIKKEKEENKTIWKIIIPIIVGVMSTIIATIIIKVLNLN